MLTYRTIIVSICIWCCLPINTCSFDIPPRSPLVFRNHSGVNAWNVIKESKSSIKSLYQHFPKRLRNVYSSNFSIFPYYDSFLAKHFPTFPVPYQFISSPTNKICDVDENINGEFARNYKYYSGDMMQSEFKPLLQQMNVNSLFKNANMLSGLVGNVWIGGKNVKATMHYDGVENIFVQIYGIKSFTLWPPQMADKFFLYGRNHPFACQSRYNDIRNNIQKSSHFTIHEYTEYCEDTIPSTVHHDAGIQITLHPGDVLYIPPYWFHEVT